MRGQGLEKRDVEPELSWNSNEEIKGNHWSPYLQDELGQL